MNSFDLSDLDDADVKFDLDQGGELCIRVLGVAQYISKGNIPKFLRRLKALFPEHFLENCEISLPHGVSEQSFTPQEITTLKKMCANNNKTVNVSGGESFLEGLFGVTNIDPETVMKNVPQKVEPIETDDTFVYSGLGEYKTRDGSIAKVCEVSLDGDKVYGARGMIGKYHVPWGSNGVFSYEQSDPKDLVGARIRSNWSEFKCGRCKSTGC